MNIRTPPPDAGQARLGELLNFEGGMRACESADALGHYLVNEGLALTGASQAFLFSPRARRMTHATAITRPDPRAPLVTMLERLSRTVGGGDPARMNLADQRSGLRPAYGFGLAIPLALKPEGDGGLLLLASRHEFSDASLVIAARMGAAAGHAFSVFPGWRLRRRLPALRLLAAAGVAVLLAAAFIPVRFSALAPAEITALDPFIIAAPLDGVIAELAVSPNASVKAGDLLARFDATGLAGRLAVAERNADAADARAKRARQGAGLSAGMRADLAIAEADAAIAGAERDQARALLERSEIRAPSPGLAIFGRSEDWTGRPVSAGERIMEIADPARIAFRIELAAGDALALEGDGEARIFLDADPLNPVEARVTRAGHLAEPVAPGRIAFPLTAEPLDPSGALRIGLRGTAQIYGPGMPLWTYVLRRPLSAFRQKFGF